MGYFLGLVAIIIVVVAVHVCGYPLRPKEDVRSPAVEVTGGYELPEVGAGS